MKKMMMLILPIICVICVSCGGSSVQTQISETDTVEDSISVAIRNQVNEQYEALGAAQVFVESKFAPKAEFESEGVIINPTDVEGRYKILQKFTDEDNETGWTKFIYRIWVQKFGDSWDYGTLEIESEASGEKVYQSNGRMKEREQASYNVNESGSIGNIKYKIPKNKNGHIYFCTKKKLTHSELKQVIKEFKDKAQSIHFFIDESCPDGGDYAYWGNKIVCDFDKNETYNEFDFLK